MTNPPLLQPNLAAFWQAFLNQAGLPPSTPCADVYAFGSGAAMADELLALVLAGKKKATCGCLRSYELGGLPLPRVGDLCLVLDGRGNPACVLRTLAVQVLPFEQMTWEICRREGEDETLASWQDGHWRFFTREAEAYGYTFSPSQLVVFEDFELVFPPAPTEDSSPPAMGSFIMGAAESNKMETPMESSPFIFGHRPTNPLVIVISGPSGIGKDAVVGLLRKTNPDTHFVITMNSRPPRPDEVDGRDYFFVSREEFERMIAANELLEHARVYSDYKGIPKSQVREALASGKDVIMRLDVQGAMTIRSLCPDAILVFLTATTKQEWIDRLEARRSDSPEEIAFRVETAKKEYAQMDNFDYIVVNSDKCLDQTIADIQAIIIAEHLKVKQRQVSL